ncbi:MAG: hypothetical protein FJX60_20590 [Alphaproteobacteria bacterium]|nr:hypothetical protein [Alphaproteobacteria bacterium]
MSLDLLLATPWFVQTHAFGAMAAFVLGLVQFAAPKGTLPHRSIGYVWVGLMLLIAGTSFAIRGDGGFSWIHILSVSVLILAPLSALAAHRHHVRRHSLAMIALFVGALVVAGGFTLLPGRIMHAVVFGG